MLPPDDPYRRMNDHVEAMKSNLEVLGKNLQHADPKIRTEAATMFMKFLDLSDKIGKASKTFGVKDGAAGRLA